MEIYNEALKELQTSLSEMKGDLVNKCFNISILKEFKEFDDVSEVGDEVYIHIEDYKNSGDPIVQKLYKMYWPILELQNHIQNVYNVDFE